MPFIVTKIVPRTMGIEVEGNLFVSGGAAPVSFRIVQESREASFYRTEGQLHIGSNLIQNSNRIFAVLNECPVMLKKNPDLHQLTLSSFILTHEGEIQEISLSVLGNEIEALET